MMLENNKHIVCNLQGKFFFSPRPDRRTPNTYINNFYQQLAVQAGIVNTGTKESGRSIELARHVFQAKNLVLNWPEDIIHLRFGVWQAILFNLCTLLVKARGGKVVWICHNRQSHNKTKPLLSKWNRVFFKRVANYIVVHSTDALEAMHDVAQKTVYMAHPRYERSSTPGLLQEQRAEVLIWGSITPYKGLEHFIAAYKQNQATFPVMIRGKAKQNYFHTLEALVAGTAINISNELLSDKELNKAFAQCSIILLPYLDSDTFSSGALIHSLNARKIVIGPHIGNFIDLANAGACITYKNDEELFATINHLLNSQSNYTITLAKLQKGIDEFYESHPWDAFTRRFLEHIGFFEPSTPQSVQPTQASDCRQAKAHPQPTNK